MTEQPLPLDELNRATMDDGDKLYVSQVVEQVLGGRLIDISFETNEENGSEVPALVFELPDGQHRTLLIYRDDTEATPGWLEVADQE